ncbi:HAD family hydrolase [Streptomyces sp. NPDC127033]|uniref:HAD family hydrolase n=1 Tax=Streptomyces sp. NPDC127033 TaxID=3347110 RepID=UPI0036567318
MGRHTQARVPAQAGEQRPEVGREQGRGLLALDFDGVVCDAFEECALITWLGEHEHDRALPGPGQLDRVPEEFTTRFRTVRDYARVLDHFVVAHLPEADEIGAQAEFDRLYASLPDARVQRFVAGASDARDWFRESETEFWLGLHTLYPGVPELLRRAGVPVVIVTAKDEPSVRAILGRHGLESAIAGVYGECAAKPEAVREACVRRGVPLEAATFVDDNLTNVRRVSATGARAWWAQWGYQTPEHRAEAAQFGITGLELTGLAGLPLTI